MQHLSLSFCSKIGFKSFEAIANNLKHLQELDLSAVGQNVDNKGILLVCQNCKDLKKLNLAGWTKLEDKDLIEIVECLPGLKSLVLTMNSHVTNSGVQNILRKAKNLKRLNLYGCASVSNEAFKLINFEEEEEEEEEKEDKQRSTSGILKYLEISHTGVNTEVLKLLAASPEFRNLRKLGIQRYLLTPEEQMNPSPVVPFFDRTANANLCSIFIGSATADCLRQQFPRLHVIMTDKCETSRWSDPPPSDKEALEEIIKVREAKFPSAGRLVVQDFARHYKPRVNHKLLSLRRKGTV